MAELTLRDRKRRRTRRAIVEAAVELFEERGYDGTTIADIAEAAEIGSRTFFSYFASKEEVLWPESDGRIVAVLEAIATRAADDGPADVLLRALREANRDSDDMVGRTAALRMRLIRTVPAVRGRGLQLQLDAQREIARHLHAAFPEELDEVGAAALVGAFVGAITGALQVLLEEAGDDLDTTRRRMTEATDTALGPWMRARES
ncbi:TetR/AcrR family transcriptional regulator [Nonomuraea soli]|uniref:AcrR family transcriptional regulator n=1 Tax=Nonomuraea soli TaxID=1032476 RepID=A0A7W0CDH0_9ACTN|nr:TetR/AcrR family transcriptional regulator [Nonomuraea soli]MBA2889129.1 AcrR family transcriptional regulator [Nonomuraea soli]